LPKTVCLKKGHHGEMVAMGVSLTELLMWKGIQLLAAQMATKPLMEDVAVNSALQSIGCVAARMCNTNNCPAGFAKQKPDLRKLLKVEKSAQQLYNFVSA
jgi:hypothetical protein